MDPPPEVSFQREVQTLVTLRGTAPETSLPVLLASFSQVCSYVFIIASQVSNSYITRFEYTNLTLG